MLRRIEIVQEFENNEIAKLSYEAMKQNPSLPIQLPLPAKRITAKLDGCKVVISIVFKE